MTEQLPGDSVTRLVGKDGVPRIRDVDLGRVLEMARPRDIRKVIERYLREGKLNDSDVGATVARTQNSGAAPRAHTEYHLTEEAALFVAAKSDMPRGTATMKMLIAAFEELRRQQGMVSRMLEHYFQDAPRQMQERLFSPLIIALTKLRGEDVDRHNPPWARRLACWVYEWSLKAAGQQQHRRLLNPEPHGTKVDYAWLSDAGLRAAERVIQTGIDISIASLDWSDWRSKMDLIFSTKPVQMQIMAPIRALPERRG